MADEVRVGIAVDDWKLPIFRKRLTDAGYVYEDAGPITGASTLLKVKTNDVEALRKVLEECQAECRRQVK